LTAARPSSHSQPEFCEYGPHSNLSKDNFHSAQLEFIIISNTIFRSLLCFERGSTRTFTSEVRYTHFSQLLFLSTTPREQVQLKFSHLRFYKLISASFEQRNSAQKDLNPCTEISFWLRPVHPLTANPNSAKRAPLKFVQRHFS
jgi:hypothetical protein